MTSRIAAFTVGYPGVHEWLRHGAAEGHWDLYDIPTDLPGGEFEVPPYDIYFVGAWHGVYTRLLKQIRAQHPEARTYVAWSSSAGEMDTAQVEIMYALAIAAELKKPRGERLIDGVGVLHPGVASVFGDAAFHLPAPVHVDEVSDVGERSGIGFFAPATVKKNIFAQLVAVQRVQATGQGWELKTNLETYRPAIEGLGIVAEISPWLPSRTALLERLASCRCALAVSHAESWCYGAVDAMMAGTPVVASPTVPTVPWSSTVDCPNDPVQIAERVLTLREHQWVHPREHVRALAETQRVAVGRVLAGLLAQASP